MKIAKVNARVLRGKKNGVWRYTSEICREISEKLDVIVPEKRISGLKGHMWDQIYMLSESSNSKLWSPANSGPVLKKSGHVVTIHDVAFFENPDWYDPRYRQYYSLMTPVLSRSAEKIITISNFSKERIIHYCNVEESKIYVIPNGVNADFMYYESSHDSIFSNARPFILTVSSFAPQKNLTRLIEAWNMVRAENKDIDLVIVGASSDAAPLSLDVNETKGIIFKSQISDSELASLYRHALLFVFPSIYEGFGLPVMEAASIGCPTVACQGTAIREYTDGVVDFINMKDPNEIYEYMRYAIKNSDKIKLTSMESREIMKKYSWKNCAMQTLDVIEE